VTPFVEMVPARPSGATIVWLHARGANGLLTDDGNPVADVEAALSGGARVIGVDVFGTGAFLEHGAPAANRLVEGPPFAPYTFGYNPPLIAARVHDVLAALRFARGGGGGVEPLDVAPQSPGEARDRPPGGSGGSQPGRVYLFGFGPEAGTWAALGRAVAPTLVDGAAIDTAGFRFDGLAAVDDAAMLPGAVKYGDIPAFIALGAPGPLWLAGERRPAPLVDAAYRAAGAKAALTIAAPKDGPRAAVAWLLRTR
jgi:hypothetical protein